ncbi:MAG: hypothetical protein QOD06_43 [Candidatus Binatota bacterium]|nr:hypothetical protein [Candidatus Binatota bacterium]
MPSRSGAAAWDTSSLMTPETVLPDQYQEKPDPRRAGEVGLLWAIFVDGVRIYCREIIRGTISSPDYREAERWVFRSGNGLTSFATLCSVFEIDSRRLRRQLLEFRDRPQVGLTELLEQQVAA